MLVGTGSLTLLHHMVQRASDEGTLENKIHGVLLT